MLPLASPGAPVTPAAGGLELGYPAPPLADNAQPAAGPVPQELANAHHQLGILQGQLTAESSSNPRLRNLIGRLRALTASVLSLTTPQPTMSRPTLSSLMGRIARLNRLLATLTRLSPASYRRLAPELLTLRSVLKSLLGHGAATPAVTPGPAGGAHGTAGGSQAVPARIPEAFAAAPATGVIPATGSRVVQTDTTLPSPTGGSPAAGPRRPVVSHPAPARPAPPVAAPSQPVQMSTGGFAASAGGAPASGAPGGVAAPVAMLVLSLLCVLMSRRLGLSGLAWRSALLLLRIERPG
jgi:hypothetical protein